MALTDPNPSRTDTSTPQANTTKPRTVCVFCGARSGNSPAHLAAARDLARAFHANNIHLVYGGGTVGVMGELARTLVTLSGPQAVHGIIPEALLQTERKYVPEEQRTGGGSASAGNADANGQGTPKTSRDAGAIIDEEVYGRTTVVPDMHTRKQAMAREVIESGGGFVALPGGYGTLEELMEVTTWNQLGIHEQGIVVYNVEGYWDGLLKWVDTAVQSGFIDDTNAGIMVEARSGDEVVQRLDTYRNAEGRFKLRWGQN